MENDYIAYLPLTSWISLSCIPSPEVKHKLLKSEIEKKKPLHNLTSQIDSALISLDFQTRVKILSNYS